MMPRAKKKKGKGKKIPKPDHSTAIKQKEQEAEQERLRNWKDSWEKKFREQEERDNAECCADKGLCLKPRTQSNVWVNVTRDRSIQEIHMSFKHVPVPKPKPPPLPPFKEQDSKTVSMCKMKDLSSEKKSNKKSKKKKRK